ncbi:MAG: YigZ family protein [Herpetosiphon sp.]
MINAPGSRYPIPVGATRSELRVANSRFVALADYCPSVEEARQQIAAARREMADASHHVYAYLVGYGASMTAGMSDDGEPSGTAGRPLLAVVRGSGLGDVCVIVVRYFGGTLLGTGGLVRAYGDAGRDVLAQIPRGERIERGALTVELPYSFFRVVHQAVEEHEGTIVDQQFSDVVELRIEAPVDRLATLEAQIFNATHGAARIAPAAPHTHTAAHEDSKQGDMGFRSV